MLTSILIIAAGLLGIVGHWVTRWNQERTDSTFWEYLKVNSSRTVASVFSNISASSTILMAVKPDMTFQEIMVLVLTAYSTGYMLDSTVNKDKSSDSTPARFEEIKNADKKKSLDAILDDDSRLD